MAGVDLKCKTPLLDYSEENVRTILAQFNRTPGNIDEDIAVIKNWFNTQPHIPIKLSDRVIAGFLVMNKFSIERTKEKLDMNFTMRSLIPEFYNMLPKDNKLILYSKAMPAYPLPKLTEKLNRVHICQIHDVTFFDPIYFLTYFFMTLDIRATSDLCNSDEYIFDFENSTFTSVAKIGPMHVKKFFLILEKVYANRIACIHIVNAPSYADAFINLLRVAMKAKLRDRLLVHKSIQEMLEYLPRVILPEEYGGEEKPSSVLNDNWMAFLRENQDYLEKMHNIKINEELRPNKLVNDEILGFHGNFRTLEVD